MSAPAANLREWLNLNETMKALGRSSSTIERLAASDRLRSKLEPRAGRKPERLYHAGDVEQLKAAAGVHAVSETAIGSASQQQLTFAYVLRELLRRSEPAALPPPSPRPWITLEEAAEDYGLAPAFLRKQIKAGRIVGVRGGPHGALRIRRESVEAFEA